MDDPARLEQRLQADEWLTPGEVARLLDTGRTKVHQMLLSGEIGYRLKPGSRHRECDPRDVARLLAERRLRRTGLEAGLE